MISWTLDPCDFLEAVPLEIAGQAVHQPAFVAVERRQRLRVFPRFLVLIHDGVSRFVERDEKRGVGSDHFGQDPGGRADLLLAAFIVN